MGSNWFIYADNNATTKISESVRKAMEPFLSKDFGNPSSKSSIGEKAKNAIDNAREKVANAIGAEKKEIIFTSGGSESNSLGINSCLCSKTQGKRILTTPIEHDSIRQNLKYLSKNYEIIYIPVNKQGELNLDYIDNLNLDDVLFCTLMYVNNEIGTINPISSISSKIKKQRNDIPIHTDAVAALGKIDISVKNLGVDYLSISGHKIHAPKGVGALYFKENQHVQPLIWGHQENELRGGTENVASIVGFGQAIEDICCNLKEKNLNTAKLRDKIDKEILKNIVDSGINGEKSDRVSNTTNLYFPGIDAIKLLFRLQTNGNGIYASNGSACNSGKSEPSHVLIAIKSDYPTSSIRISLSHDTSDHDVDILIDLLISVVNEMKKEVYNGSFNKF